LEKLVVRGIERTEFLEVYQGHQVLMSGEDSIGVREERPLVSCRLMSNEDGEVLQEAEGDGAAAESGWADMHEQATRDEGELRPGARSRAGARLRTLTATTAIEDMLRDRVRGLGRIREIAPDRKLALPAVEAEVDEAAAESRMRKGFAGDLSVRKRGLERRSERSLAFDRDA